MKLLNYNYFNTMQLWINFWIFFFWLSIFAFLFNPSNFLSLLFYSEITWLCLYCFSILIASINDDINLMSNTFFILGLAGLEFSFGFLLLILFKNFNISLILIKENNLNNNFLFNSKKLNFLNKFFWIK